MSSSGRDASASSDRSLTIENVPPAVLQSLYHAVTGKTERLRKELRKNVVVRKADLENLFQTLKHKIDHYDVLLPPVVSVLVRLSNRQTLQYSSWERFRNFEVAASDTTSEVGIKVEFVLRIPNTPAPQRCTVNVDIDSKLPVLDRDDDDDIFPTMYFVTKLPTVVVSVDFVDFLIGKEFSQVVEDWFNSLEEMSNPRWGHWLSSNGSSLSRVMDAVPGFGIAFFLLTYVVWFGGQISSLQRLSLIGSIALLLYFSTELAIDLIGIAFERASHRITLPSFIILTAGDERRSKIQIEKSAQIINRIWRIPAYVMFTIILNIASSWLCGRLIG